MALLGATKEWKNVAKELLGGGGGEGEGGENGGLSGAALHYMPVEEAVMVKVCECVCVCV